jgi:hypothetical protein
MAPTLSPSKLQEAAELPLAIRPRGSSGAGLEGIVMER